MTLEQAENLQREMGRAPKVGDFIETDTRVLRAIVEVYEDSRFGEVARLRNGALYRTADLVIVSDASAIVWAAIDPTDSQAVTHGR